MQMAFLLREAVSRGGRKKLHTINQRPISSDLPLEHRFDLNEPYQKLSRFETRQGERPIWMRDGASITIRAEIRCLVLKNGLSSLNSIRFCAKENAQAANLQPGHINIVWSDADDPQAPEIAERVSRFLLFIYK